MSKRLEEFDFTLLLDGIDSVTTEIENALFNAGCDDGTISRRYGRTYITFSREAESFVSAVISAIKAVWESGIGATVVRIDHCDLVTQSEIARRIGRSRQLVSFYISGARGPSGFPAPACNITEGTPLWYWCEVAYWLHENNIIREEEMREAQNLAVINSLLELQHQRQILPEPTREIMQELSLCEKPCHEPSQAG